MGYTYRQLSLEERCTIARLHEAGQSIRQIASTLDRAASSIAREIKRNSGVQVGYMPAYAQQQALSRRWRGSRMERNDALRTEVFSRLAQGHSPEQVAGRLALEHGRTIISHESIYRFIYAQLRRTNDHSWRHYLPRAKSKRGYRTRKGGHGIHAITHRTSIRERPDIVAKRQQFGHWEADLMMFSNKKHNLMVAQERTSRFILLALQDDKKSQRIIDTQRQWFSALPPPMRQTLTQDNGTEFALHHQLHEIGIQTFFCNPHSPWQKGGVENMNARLRRYLPLNAPVTTISKLDIQQLANKMNHTPRKCLGFKTPDELFSQQLLHFKCESTFPLLRE